MLSIINKWIAFVGRRVRLANATDRPFAITFATFALFDGLCKEEASKSGGILKNSYVCFRFSEISRPGSFVFCRGRDTIPCWRLIWRLENVDVGCTCLRVQATSRHLSPIAGNCSTGKLVCRCNCERRSRISPPPFHSTHIYATWEITIFYCLTKNTQIDVLLMRCQHHWI